jgi:hypothetical protein
MTLLRANSETEFSVQQTLAEGFVMHAPPICPVACVCLGLVRLMRELSMGHILRERDQKLS